MNVPIELISAVVAVLLAAILSNQRANRHRIERLEKKVLTIIIMLQDHGLKIPKSGDTERFSKLNL